MKHFFTTAAMVVAPIILIIFFQNCGGPSDAKNTSTGVELGLASPE